METNSRNALSARQAAFLAAVCLIAVGLRFTSLGRSFWLDEVVTVMNIDVPSWQTVVVETSHDNQPPLYNLAAFFWGRLFGLSEIAVRSLPLAFGLLALGTPWLAPTALGRNEKLWNLVVLSLMTLPIRYAQEARNYSLLFLLSCACFYSFYESNAKDQQSPPLLFFVCLTLLAFTHIFGVMLALSFVAVMFWRTPFRGRRTSLLLYAALLTAATLGPLVHGGAARQAGGHFWITFGPKVVGVELLKLFTPVGILSLAYGILRWRVAPQRMPPGTARLWSLAPCLLMMGGALLVSLHTPIFMSNYLIGIIPAFALVLSWLVQPEVCGIRPMAALGGVFLLLVQALALSCSPFLFVQEDLRAIARNSIALDSKVCYVAPDGTGQNLDEVWGYYVERRFARLDLAPLLVPEAKLAEPQSVETCGLWAEAHMPKRGVTILHHYPQFARCRDIPLGRPGVAMASVLLDCRG